MNYLNYIIINFWIKLIFIFCLKKIINIEIEESGVELEMKKSFFFGP